MVLSDLHTGESGIITRVKGQGAFRKRIIEMGFVKGKKVTVIKNAPLKDPIEYQILGYEVSLRRSEAALIEVMTLEEARNLVESQYNGVIDEEILKTSAREKTTTIHIGLVGNPNCGKTTLFNYASNSNEHVGNYSGVTVGAKQAVFRFKGYTFSIMDLPGTYSLTAYSPEELFVRNYISSEHPDLIINVVDASNLERNLYLTTQLIDMNIKVIVALNMYDDLEKSGDKFDYEHLGKMIGIPIVPTVGSKGKGLQELFSKAIEVYEDRDPTVRHVHISYFREIEEAIRNIREKTGKPENTFLTSNISGRFIAIKLLEKDKEAEKLVAQCYNRAEITETASQEIKKLENRFHEDSETLITDSRYGFINGALKETYKAGHKARHKKTAALDAIITHKHFGFPIFIFLMWLMFFSTFNLGQYPMGWIEQLVNYTGHQIGNILPDCVFRDLLIDGIIGGVGGVIVFLPNILLLFFFISLMEDTGYMARAAFIMDKLMHAIGLHGKSFIPLIMGFGCNVPAIMAARTIENRNDRLLTILINPFMSCSARLPVYVLLITAFFPEHPSLVLFGIYLTGILLCIIISILFKKLLFKSKEAPFVMELPPYRIPTVRNTLRNMWFKAAMYLKKVSGIILIASLVIWALGYFPRKADYSKDYKKLITITEQSYKHQLAGITDTTSAYLEFSQEIRTLQLAMKKEQQEQSYIGRIGKFIEPVMAPLGFDWKMSISLLSGVAAKEIVVSTMGVLYLADDVDGDHSQSLISKLKTQRYTYGNKEGQKVFDPLVALSFMLFILIYFPCIGVIATIRRETGSWKWAVFTILYTTGLAWMISFIVYQTGSLIL
ncbi:MAG: ferrous iron transport protein B [Bacteroidota bacterium]